MTTKSENDRPEDRPEGPNLKDSPIVTRDQMREEAKPTKPGETVTLTDPRGTKVTTSAENAEALRDAGYS